MTFANDLADATASAVCGWLANGGNATASTFIAAGTFFPPTSLAARGAALALMATDLGCNFNPNGGTKATVDGLKGCIRYHDGRSTNLWVGFENWRYANWAESNVVEVLASWWTTGFHGPIINWKVKLTDGSIKEGGLGPGAYGAPVGISRMWPVVECGSDGISAPGFDPVLGPTTYVAPGGCNWQVDFESWLIDQAGRVRPVVKIAPSGVSGFASGGVIGGCNFNPIVYVGGGSGGGDDPWWGPWGPGPVGPDGKPWWYQLLKAGADALLEFAVAKVLNDLLTPELPAVTYRLKSVCEIDDEGEAVDKAVEKVIPAGKGLDAIADRLDALAEIAQGLKDFKQPTCDDNKVPSTLPGQAHTLRFVSTEKSPYGDNPLRKEFRYRSQVEVDPATHRAHWENFTWRSGPWMVISEGANWGKPRVWAATPEEGKRVLLHAAAIAGEDLSVKEHRFVERLVTNDRYGVELTMRPRRAPDGEIWLTTRSGPSGYAQFV